VAHVSTTIDNSTRNQWTSDFFGALNEVPPEPLAGLVDILEVMGTEPAFRAARRTVLDALRVRDAKSVLEAGCGTGVALPDILELGGQHLNVVGFDPTEAFVAHASERARLLGARNATYQVGDIRALPLEDANLDAAFCDKVMIHAGPPSATLGELVRVVREGNRIGAIEWYPQFALSTSDPSHATTLNAMFRTICNDYTVATNLGRHFRAAGLQDVLTQTSVAQTDSLSEHPFWSAFLIDQLPMFVHAQVLDAPVADALAEDLQRLSARGDFHASFIIRTAVGTKRG
jgi:ubiquinone/menaquinone biosynthesis C-methylase UbiE